MANPQKIKFKSVADFLKSLPSGEWEIVELLRELIVETVPDVQERLAYNVPFYYRNRRIAFIWPASVPCGNIKEGVALGFVAGNALLKTDVNADSKVERIVFKSVSEIDPEWVRQLLYEAILVDDQFNIDRK
ncbi:DUF1801 domain-containing protein [Flavobacterium sp.]|uniref:DUF1801 domain-containing protein n=1 Tax=Flavobacterium sp. TaxID=239 RepID=UPI0026066E6C|nr:DUF1801 domain-containing protein [Flavobacterium sp.]